MCQNAQKQYSAGTDAKIPTPKEYSLSDSLQSKLYSAMNRADTLSWIILAMGSNPPAKHVERELEKLLNWL